MEPAKLPENFKANKLIQRIQFISEPHFTPVTSWTNLNHYQIARDQKGRFGLKTQFERKLTKFITDEQSKIFIPENEPFLYLNRDQLRAEKEDIETFVEFNNYLVSNNELFAYLSRLENKDYSLVITFSQIGPDPSKKNYEIIKQPIPVYLF